MFRIINRYIFKELAVPFVTALFMFTFVMLLSRILQLTELVVNRGVSVLDIFLLFAYATPYFFVFTIPMAVLFAVVLTFMRLSADNEITALKAAGLSLYQLLPPVLLISLIGGGLTIFVSTYVLPRANTALNDHMFKMASSKAEVLIKDRLFITEFPGMVLYVESTDPRTRELERVLVSDDRDPDMASTILAKRGLLLRDRAERALVLRLYNGSIDRLSSDHTKTETILFATYDIKLDLRELLAAHKSRGRHREEYKMAELLEELEKTPKDTVRYYLFFMVFHERLSIPFACICLGLLGAPLGIQSKAKRTSSGLILAVAAYVSYYLLYVAAKSLGETGFYPPLLGLWMPNIVFTSLAVYLVVQTARERSWAVASLGQRIFKRVHDLLRKY